MGRIVGKWCFTGFGPKAKRKPYCTDAVIDTGASLPTIPLSTAKRLGVRVRDVAPELVPQMPRDAQGHEVTGDYYLLGTMSSADHGCHIDPVLVFGQPGRWRRRGPVIGREPLQTMGVDIVMDSLTKDGMRCRRLAAGAKSVGAGVNLIALIKSRLPKGKPEI